MQPGAVAVSFSRRPRHVASRVLKFAAALLTVTALMLALVRTPAAAAARPTQPAAEDADDLPLATLPLRTAMLSR